MNKSVFHNRRIHGLVRLVAAGIMLFSGMIPILAQSSATGRSREASTYVLTVRANIPDAVVYIDGRNYGRATYQGKHTAGVYEVRVTAPGFREYIGKVNLNRNLELDVELKPAGPMVTIIIPHDILDPMNRRAASLVSVFVDGKEINSQKFTTTPGKHDIAIRSGGLYIEKGFLFQAGREYVIELTLDLE